MTSRRATTATDRSRVRTFIEELGGEDAHTSVGERKLIGLARGEQVSVIEEDGAILGVVFETPGAYPTIEVAAAPGHAAVARRVFADLIRTTPLFRVWTLGDRWGDLLRELGLERERTLLRMEVTLPVVRTDVGFVVTGFAPTHLAQWLAVNNAAFANHPEQGDWTPAQFEQRTGLSWWDPDDLRMAWDGERLAGFCWTKVHADGSGEIYVIGLDPAYQRRGWGKQLVLEGLRHLYEAKGCTLGLLYVDASNEAAVATYERIGFRTGSVDRSYVWPGGRNSGAATADPRDE